jgi:hypothetical protein
MTTRAKLLALATAISGLAPTSGCSWYFVRPLSAESAGVGYRDCTTSRIPPVVDTLFALTYVAEAIYVGGSDQATHKDKDAAVAVGLALASVWALSATYGYWKTNECEDLIAAQRTAMPPAPLWGTSQPQLYPHPPPSGAPPAETLTPAPAVAAPAVAPRVVAPSKVQQPDGGN